MFSYGTTPLRRRFCQHRKSSGKRAGTKPACMRRAGLCARGRVHAYQNFRRVRRGRCARQATQADCDCRSRRRCGRALRAGISYKRQVDLIAAGRRLSGRRPEAVEKLQRSFSTTGCGLLRARAVRQKRTACTLAGRSVFFPTYTPPEKIIYNSFAASAANSARLFDTLRPPSFRTAAFCNRILTRGFLFTARSFSGIMYAIKFGSVVHI